MFMNNDDAVRLLRACVAMPSPSYHERPFSEFLAETLPTWGFRTRVDRVGNFIAERGEGPERGILLGHVDTVPGEIPVR